MTGSVLKVWTALLLLPLIPVILLYVFFEGQNYFELQDAAKGLVAIGPIAAYVAIVLIGWRIYLKIPSSLTPSNPMAGALDGNWSFQSVSRHGRVREGQCYIRNDKGELHLTGEFCEGSKHIGNWESEMTCLKENKLYMIYSLREFKDDGVHNVDGICILSFGSRPISKMSGIWIVAGRESMSGSIEYQKKN